MSAPQPAAALGTVIVRPPVKRADAQPAKAAPTPARARPQSAPKADAGAVSSTRLTGGLRGLLPPCPAAQSALVSRLRGCLHASGILPPDTSHVTAVAAAFASLERSVLFVGAPRTERIAPRGAAADAAAAVQASLVAGQLRPVARLGCAPGRISGPAGAVRKHQDAVYIFGLLAPGSQPCEAQKPLQCLPRGIDLASEPPPAADAAISGHKAASATTQDDAARAAVQAALHRSGAADAATLAGVDAMWSGTVPDPAAAARKRACSSAPAAPLPLDDWRRISLAHTATGENEGGRDPLAPPGTHIARAIILTAPRILAPTAPRRAPLRIRMRVHTAPLGSGGDAAAGHGPAWEGEEKEDHKDEDAGSVSSAAPSQRGGEAARPVPATRRGGSVVSFVHSWVPPEGVEGAGMHPPSPYSPLQGTPTAAWALRPTDSQLHSVARAVSSLPSPHVCVPAGSGPSSDPAGHVAARRVAVLGTLRHRLALLVRMLGAPAGTEVAPDPLDPAAEIGEDEEEEEEQGSKGGAMEEEEEEEERKEKEEEDKEEEDKEGSVAAEAGATKEEEEENPVDSAPPHKRRRSAAAATKAEQQAHPAARPPRSRHAVASLSALQRAKLISRGRAAHGAAPLSAAAAMCRLQQRSALSREACVGFGLCSGALDSQASAAAARAGMHGSMHAARGRRSVAKLRREEEAASRALRSLLDGVCAARVSATAGKHSSLQGHGTGEEGQEPSAVFRRADRRVSAAAMGGYGVLEGDSWSVALRDSPRLVIGRFPARASGPQQADDPFVALAARVGPLAAAAAATARSALATRAANTAAAPGRSLTDRLGAAVEAAAAVAAADSEPGKRGKRWSDPELWRSHAVELLDWACAQSLAAATRPQTGAAGADDGDDIAPWLRHAALVRVDDCAMDDVHLCITWNAAVAAFEARCLSRSRPLWVNGRLLRRGDGGVALPANAASLLCVGSSWLCFRSPLAASTPRVPASLDARVGALARCGRDGALGRVCGRLGKAAQLRWGCRLFADLAARPLPAPGTDDAARCPLPLLVRRNVQCWDDWACAWSAEQAKGSHQEAARVSPADPVWEEGLAWVPPPATAGGKATQQQQQQQQQGVVHHQRPQQPQQQQQGVVHHQRPQQPQQQQQGVVQHQRPQQPQQQTQHQLQHQPQPEFHWVSSPPQQPVQQTQHPSQQQLRPPLQSFDSPPPPPQLPPVEPHIHPQVFEQQRKHAQILHRIQQRRQQLQEQQHLRQQVKQQLMQQLKLQKQSVPPPPPPPPPLPHEQQPPLEPQLHSRAFEPQRQHSRRPEPPPLQSLYPPPPLPHEQQHAVHPIHPQQHQPQHDHAATHALPRAPPLPSPLHGAPQGRDTLAVSPEPLQHLATRQPAVRTARRRPRAWAVSAGTGALRSSEAPSLQARTPASAIAHPVVPGTESTARPSALFALGRPALQPWLSPRSR